MLTPDRSNGPTAQPYWPAPAASTPTADIDVARRRATRGPGRRRLATAAIAVATIAAGTVGGALAGRNTRHNPNNAAPVTTVAPATTVKPPTPTVTTVAPATTVKPATTVRPPGTTVAPTTTPTQSPVAIDTESAAPSAPSKVDVSALIDTALPSVVSITVQLKNGQAAGTGFVISDDGQIATNAHVVADAASIDVEFSDGSSSAASVLGVDRTDDLAVIKVDKAGLVPLPLGNSAQLKMGEPVVAIGNALDLTGGPTATEGIVSALDRTIDTQEGSHLSHLVQTDAAINPGNSGGPLLTLDGKVVGINSAGSQDAQNIGFAIAIDTARPIVEQLQAGKTITKAYLGVTTTSVDATVAAQNGLDIDHGVLVVDVAGGSAAESAGLQPGDVIVSVNGTTIDDNSMLGDLIRSTGAGNVVHLEVHRDGNDIAIDATLSTHAA